MESYLVGATGWVSVAGNVVPGLVTKMYEHFQNGELKSLGNKRCNFTSL